MGWRINEVIERELIDDNCPQPIYSEIIEFKGNSITDTVFIKQGDQTVGMTYWQLYDLYKILKENQYIFGEE